MLLHFRASRVLLLLRFRTSCLGLGYPATLHDLDILKYHGCRDITYLGSCKIVGLHPVDTVLIQLPLNCPLPFSFDFPHSQNA